VRRSRAGLRFCFVGKSGVEHTITVDDEDVIAALDRMRSRRARSRRLLAYSVDRRWVDLDAAAVNAYLAEVLGGDLTAKDFRTWHGTVLAAAALAESEEPGDTKASRKRAVKAAVEEVAGYLGNTPAIARGSYIDPRVIDLYENGTTIVPPRVTARTSPMRRQELLEKAVLELLT
jgi:DNA topoisomerase IB